MKNNMKYILGAALMVGFAASCSKLNEMPVFDASESFAAFEVSTYSLPEDGGTLTIPVSIAALEPVRTTVAYEILDANVVGSGYTAKEGVDFVDTNTDKVLIFDGKTMTQNIVLNIINRAGEYTGDLTFGIRITSAKGLKLSAEKLTVVKITDNDHPLAPVLGKYDCTGEDVSFSPVSWVMELSKDPVDVHTVHIDCIMPACVQFASWGSWEFVGTVSEDLKTITIERGQKTQAWYQSETDVFELVSCEFDGSMLTNILESGNIVMTLGADGKWTSDVSTIWLYPVETKSWYGNFCLSNFSWKKQ